MTNPINRETREALLEAEEGMEHDPELEDVDTVALMERALYAVLDEFRQKGWMVQT
jgi:hypothetical protein